MLQRETLRQPLLDSSEQTTTYRVLDATLTKGVCLGASFSDDDAKFYQPVLPIELPYAGSERDRIPEENMETIRSRNGRETLRRQDPYERSLPLNSADGGSSPAKRRRGHRQRLKDEQIDMRYFWAFLGLLAVAVFTFAYVNGGTAELQNGENAAGKELSDVPEVR